MSSGFSSQPPKQNRPIIDENGVVYLTRTTKKGG
jgi:hypothetical protein